MLVLLGTAAATNRSPAAEKLLTDGSIMLGLVQTQRCETCGEDGPAIREEVLDPDKLMSVRSADVKIPERATVVK